MSGLLREYIRALAESKYSNVWYHGSQRKFDDFQIVRKATITQEVADVPIFLSSNKKFASLHARNGYIYHVIPHVTNPLEIGAFYVDGSSKYWPPEYESLTALGQQLYDDLQANKIIPGLFSDNERGWEDLDGTFAYLLQHKWDAMEHPGMLGWIKSHGFDAVQVTGESDDDVLAVFEPSKLEIVKVEKS